jgi:hypothetical protein
MNYVSFHRGSDFKISGISSEGIVHHEYAAQDNYKPALLFESITTDAIARTRPTKSQHCAY